MTQHLMVVVDSSGTSVVFVPLHKLWEFLRSLPSGLAVISYDHRTHQAKVSLPGLRPPIARQVIDAALEKDGDFCEPDRRFPKS